MSYPITMLFHVGNADSDSALFAACTQQQPALEGRRQNKKDSEVSHRVHNRDGPSDSESPLCSEK